jgi:hypothetical protein
MTAGTGVKQLLHVGNGAHQRFHMLQALQLTYHFVLCNMLVMLQGLGLPFVLEVTADASPPADQLTAAANADDLAGTSGTAEAVQPGADLDGSEVEPLDNSATTAAAVAAAAAAAAAAASTDDSAVKVGVILRVL